MIPRARWQQIQSLFEQLVDAGAGERCLAARHTVHAGLLRVDPVLLGQLLRLPDGWEVRRIRMAHDSFDDAVLLVVEAPELPETEVGAQLHEINVRFTKHGDGSISAEWDIAGAEVGKVGFR